MTFNHFTRLVLLAFVLQGTQALGLDSETTRLAPRALRFQRRTNNVEASKALKLAINDKSDDGARPANQTSAAPTEDPTKKTTEIKLGTSNVANEKASATSLVQDSQNKTEGGTQKTAVENKAAVAGSDALNKGSGSLTKATALTSLQDSSAPNNATKEVKTDAGVDLTKPGSAVVAPKPEKLSQTATSGTNLAEKSIKSDDGDRPGKQTSAALGQVEATKNSTESKLGTSNVGDDKSKSKTLEKDPQKKTEGDPQKTALENKTAVPGSDALQKGSGSLSKSLQDLSASKNTGSEEKKDASSASLAKATSATGGAALAEKSSTGDTIPTINLDPGSQNKTENKSKTSGLELEQKKATTEATGNLKAATDPQAVKTSEAATEPIKFESTDGAIDINPKADSTAKTANAAAAELQTGINNGNTTTPPELAQTASGGDTKTQPGPDSKTQPEAAKTNAGQPKPDLTGAEAQKLEQKSPDSTEPTSSPPTKSKNKSKKKGNKLKVNKEIV
ncbi:hypothetical protein PGT21_014375 [Puccinia graminis f. sp. tritici]|uniref:Uncharacterized protein n=1 Tax=Puccinia graminis f. sp. tritici TaxID=56615 RepID=A0A5B0PBC9_PUCGR|nr:hypothetical protein PGTUg99_019943 [Puccinia graminis f. sp. tritici]KAA1105650.1 hypothetical protein PGT21_014375 [Puccinia graminis f. sp. tritici]